MTTKSCNTLVNITIIIEKVLISNYLNVCSSMMEFNGLHRMTVLPVNLCRSSNMRLLPYPVGKTDIVSTCKGRRFLVVCCIPLAANAIGLDKTPLLHNYHEVLESKHK